MTSTFYNITISMSHRSALVGAVVDPCRNVSRAC